MNVGFPGDETFKFIHFSLNNTTQQHILLRTIRAYYITTQLRFYMMSPQLVLLTTQHNNKLISRFLTKTYFLNFNFLKRASYCHLVYRVLF